MHAVHCSTTSVKFNTPLFKMMSFVSKTRKDPQKSKKTRLPIGSCLNNWGGREEGEEEGEKGRREGGEEEEKDTLESGQPAGEVHNIFIRITTHTTNQPNSHHHALSVIPPTLTYSIHCPSR